MNSDVEIAGDPLALLHLMPPVRAHPATVAGFAGLARTIAADRPGWAPLVQYDATSRWYHRLRTGPGYEVWLLSWLPGQSSGRHDHGPSSGVLTVLDGELTEHTENASHKLAPGTQRAFAPGYVHEVVNDGLAPAVSLHIYFPGLTEMPMVPQGFAWGDPRQGFAWGDPRQGFAWGDPRQGFAWEDSRHSTDAETAAVDH